MKYNYIIDLKEGKLPLNFFIYNLSCKELEILQEYLNSLLKKGWIQPSKSLVSILILFIPKQDGIIRLYIDYYSFNKVSEILNQLFKVKIFTKLNL